MTTMTPPTDAPPPPGDSAPPPPPPPPGPAPARRLQRSRTDKVAGGVAGGLGEYFGLDPVLFRVLFAVAAFFGGFGLIAYAVLWFALPEVGDRQTSPVDRLGAWLREHNVPLWLAGVVGVVLFWLVIGGFGGWWGHGFFFPGAAVIGVVLLIVAFSRRGATGAPASGQPPAQGAPTAHHQEASDQPTISLLKPEDAADADDRPMDQWYREARQRGRARRRRARPLFSATLAAVVVGIGVVVIVDAATGVALPVYGLVGGGIALLGLLIGVAARRPAFSLTWVILPALVWVAAFSGTHTSFRDGAGEVAYRPTSLAELDDDYRLAFGRITLDLRGVYDDAATGSAPGQVTVRVGAGVSRVVLPQDADVTVVAEVRLGAVLVDGVDEKGSRQGAGWRATTRIPPTGTDGPPLVVILQVTDGAAVVDHVS